MADETPMSPITAAEPPKAAALSEAGTPAASTLKLKPVIRKPIVGATQSALKPGLKLPPKTGATVSELRPGLKLPPKPGASGVLKPGLKLPAKPVIRKPGSAESAVSIPKPVSPVAAEPASQPAEPAAPVAKIDMSGVAKLPTVEMQAIRRDEELKVPEAPKPMEALKSVTQKLKGITQQIPAQAILHKTGIIADGAVSDAQKQAAKSKTARISLSDAMGVAPVKNEAAPMKTIRIKRPVDIPGAAKSPEPATAVGPAAEKSAEAAAEVKSETAEEAPSTVTQRKTLKISRPTGGAVRPGGKFGIKRAGAATPAPAAAKISGSETSAADTGDAVADIADIPPLPMPPPPVAAEPVSDVPAWVTSLSAVVQIAACIVIGALAWLLYSDSQILPF